jgi:flagellar assembly protein FliH
MGAPAKFLFDVDFAAGGEREATVTLAEHATELAEAEAAAQRRGYAQAQSDAAVETSRRIAGTLERIAGSLAEATKALAAIEARLECEAVEVAVAVARKLAPALIEREPFAEISALASNCFRELVAAPHVVVRVNDSLYAAAREKLDDIARAHGFEGKLVACSANPASASATAGSNGRTAASTAKPARPKAPSAKRLPVISARAAAWPRHVR